ncbi:hypothetical protein AB4Y30_12105 [Ornithinibacillus sp. 4-3]|uniref:Poly(Glycerol-phosphate) alpha-glucosyltransferase n=1 Tax=Ornithinibacillus sp. 4-3 TaxID=3231488 RepID=A0AB39HMK7_9BACI
MSELTNLQQFNTAIERFLTKKQLEWMSTIPVPEIKGRKKAIVFISIGQLNQRAKVFRQSSNHSFQQAVQKVLEQVQKWVRKNQPNLSSIKIDFVHDIKQISYKDLEKMILQYKKNYFRYGISFNEDFSLSFLEQEINGNAFIRESKQGKLAIDETNIRHYLKINRYKIFNFNLRLLSRRPFYLFNTYGFFFNMLEDRKWIELYSGELTNGIRKIPNLKREIERIIKKSTYYLKRQVQFSGKFNYGYFSAFAKNIGTYNILRHASSLYSMLEGYEVIKDKKILDAASKSLKYLIDFSLIYKDRQTAYIVDQANDHEIKLGSNATAILAITKYTTVSNDDSYMVYAKHLANGILSMKDPNDNHFYHVLKYPEFETKEKFRIIYYEGEAIFALLRLYQIDRDEKWLEAVKDYFEIFIAEDYWKYHDHWLSYAVNELTDHVPEDKYFQFGLKNCSERLEFIYHRNTTFPTFLELTMAAYKMVKKIKQMDKGYLLDGFNESFLNKTIDKRAEYQRVGFMYPELAMYFKVPELVLDGFFIRHHSFRVRIDDVEHNLSGYIQYLLYRIPDLDEQEQKIPYLLEV